MSKVKDWAMDLEEQFWSDAEDIMKESESFNEALATIREKLTYPPLIDDNDEVEEQLSEQWNELWSQYA
jgi:hypothetical protein|tara:strand:+ start:2043 stop:2249 length:207 start_codon:yes stop_codon:yes gene_type:complete